MTDITTPAERNAVVDNKSTGHAISKAGGHSGYVVDGVDIAQFYPEITTGNLNGFAHASSTGLDITISGGEAFVFGWLCRDRQTTITLPASSSVTICVGYNPEATLLTGEAPTDSENILLDVESQFTNGAPKLPLWEVTTDASTITNTTDVRPLGQANVNSNMFASASEHSSLQSSHNTLRSDHDTLRSDHNTLRGDHDALRTDHDGLATDYNSFRSGGGTIGGSVTINGTDLHMPNATGDAGLLLANGSKYSTYEGWTTIYSYSDQGGLGVKFRNPNTGGDMFAVDATTGDATLRGEMTQNGNDVVDSASGHYEIQKNGTDGTGIINFKT